eukprot:CAMPEP_0197637610 /NCGR_PEP_ID=MMETSP1338-20131121/12782_1 /TAXON_ID=43686 ORGANISM="Pelagodinium beii, Strain RCC1491" /NCGR_SAMPLE_ID=MMETSP1338 /ASSEMBLY_ACC=CAM_ASM_000754 /LENGTH=108 /DNA_ID=CAMNT_0043210049 /DNA_START=52 /DNA_END=375 /DNA_ORIENTATION=-
MASSQAVLLSFSLLVVAVSLAGCGCDRQTVIDCLGELPANCANENPFDDGRDCCDYYDKMVTCHESNSCTCDTERDELDGFKTVKAYMNEIQKITLGLCKPLFKNVAW